MKLALLVEYYPPSRASAAVQMSELAQTLEREGHEVTVFTTSAEITAPCVRDEAGVTVVRVPTRKSKGIGLVRRAVNEIFMSLTLWRGTRRCRIPVHDLDGIVWYSPTIFLAPFVAWLKQKSHARSYLILRDIFPQWALDAGVMQRGPAYYFFKVFEQFQYRTADVIGVQSPANLEYVVRVPRRPQQRIEVLYNWIDLARAEPPETDLLQRYRIADRKVLVYGGNMGVAQDMSNLMRLAERIHHANDIALLLLGSGSEVSRMKAAIEDKQLKNVVLADEIDPEAFRSVLRRCHAGIITLDRRLTTHNIPGKLLAYLEAGLPVIASVNPGNDLLTIIQAANVGLGFVNGDDDAFAEAAVSLVRNPERCAEMSERARILGKDRFSVESITRQLLTSFDEVSQPHAAVEA